MSKTAVRLSCLAALLAAAACSRTDVFSQTGPAATVQVALTPNQATVQLTRSANFVAGFTPAELKGSLTWSVSPAGVGAVGNDGIYTAPATLAEGADPHVIVRASLDGQPGVYGEAIVTLAPLLGGPPARLEKVFGDAQTVTVGTVLPQPLLVKVTDADGVVLAGVPVIFSTPAGENASITAVTGSDGLASADPVAGTVAGPQTFGAASAGLEPVAFDETAVAGPLAHLTASGTPAQAVAGTDLMAPLTVTFTDQYGNPIPGRSATAEGPIGASATAQGATSDATGKQTFVVHLAPILGTQTFVITDSEDPTFSATVTIKAIAGPPATLVMIGGDGQTGHVGSNLAAPLMVQVLDSNGLPVSGVAIAWQTPDGGTFTATQRTTDALGEASTGLTLGRAAGVQRINVSSTALPNAALTFIVTATAGNATQLVLVGGDNQTTGAGQPFGGAFSVRAVDQFMNAVSGVLVQFAVTAGGGSVAPPTFTTGADGLAQTRMTAGALGGTQGYRATSGNLTAVTLTLTATPPIYTLTVVSGQRQTGTISTTLAAPLVVKLTANGQPVANQTITFAAVTGGGLVTPTTAATNAQGQAQTTAKLGGTVGAQRFSAAFAAATNSPVFFDETAIGVSTLVAVSGDGQNGIPGATLGAPFVVRALDANGRPVVGATITFTAPAGGSVTPTSAVTDTNGQVSVVGKLGLTPGTQTFAATSGSATLTLRATATVIAPTYRLTLVSGNSQTGTAGTQLAQPLVVRVVDASNNGVPNIPISWTAIGGGALSNQQTLTNTNGSASANLTLSNTAGAESVQVAATPAPPATITASPVTFQMTAVAGPATQLVLVSGSGQTTAAGAPYGGAFSVRALDARGNQVTNAQVQFSVVAGGGAVSPATDSTDTTGLAQTQMTAGATGGTQTFKALLVGTMAAVTINLAATPPGLYHLAIVSGDAQSGTAGSALAQPLVVKVTLNGVAAANRTVTFAIALGGGSITPVTVNTNASGVAQATATLGTVAGAQRFAASIDSADTSSPVFFDATATGTNVSVLRVISGNGQTSNPSAVLPLPLVVQALDANGQPVANATITFTPPTGGRVSATTVTTNAQGQAQITGTLGPAVGTQIFTAKSGNATATFTETASSVMTGRRIVIVSGQNQSAQVGLALPQPLVVRVTNDGGGPLAGIAVSWAAAAQLATVSSASVTTDANGLAQVTARLGKPIGAQSFTASCAMCSGSPATFTANGTVAPAERLVIAAGDGQSALTGATLANPLVAQAVDRVGNGVSGVAITFAAVTGGGSVTPATGTSGADGKVSTTARLGSQTGPQTFKASATNLGSVTFTATATRPIASLSISPQNLDLQQGASQQYVATAIYTDGTTGVVTDLATWSSSSTAVATIGNATGTKGLAVAGGAGTTTISATFSGKTGTTPLTVEAATLVSIVVTPANASIGVDSTLQFHALGTYSNNLVSDVTGSCVWSTANATVASVAPSGSSAGLVTGNAAGVTNVICTLMGKSGLRQLTVTGTMLVQLEITPTAVNQPAGTAVNFRATATYADGTVQNVTTSATWSSTDTALVTVQNAPAQAGRATLIATGTTTVNAVFGGFTAHATVKITAATVVSLALTPDQVDMTVNDFILLRLQATYSDGTVSDATSLASWSSSDQVVADVSNAPGSFGKVTAQSTGTVTITASYGGKTATASVTVDDLQSQGLRVFPRGSRPDFNANATTVSCAAGGTVALDAGELLVGSGMQFRVQIISDQASWTSSDPLIAVAGQGSVDGGTIQCLKQGTVTITATWQGQSDTAKVNVTAATLKLINVSPAALSLALGDTKLLHATGVYTDGTELDLTALATWTSSDNNVVTVSNAAGNQGRTTSVSTGMATITVAYKGVTTTVPVSVSTATLTNIVIAPADPTIQFRTGGGGPPGGRNTKQLTATALYSDGSTSDVTALAAWTSATPSVATVVASGTQAGLVTAAARGTSAIGVTYSGFSSTTTLTVF